MEKAQRLVLAVVLCVLCLGLCLAQHWSFGLQPGGKRSAQALLGPLQEIASDLEKLEEVQQCPGSEHGPRLGGLQETLERLLEGEGRKKEI